MSLKGILFINHLELTNLGALRHWANGPASSSVVVHTLALCAPTPCMCDLNWAFRGVENLCPYDLSLRLLGVENNLKILRYFVIIYGALYESTFTALAHKLSYSIKYWGIAHLSRRSLWRLSNFCSSKMSYFQIFVGWVCVHVHVLETVDHESWTFALVQR